MSKKNLAMFNDTCSVGADGLCIGSPRLVGGRKVGNSNMAKKNFHHAVEPSNISAKSDYVSLLHSNYKFGQGHLEGQRGSCVIRGGQLPKLTQQLHIPPLPSDCQFTILGWRPRVMTNARSFL